MRPHTAALACAVLAVPGVAAAREKIFQLDSATDGTVVAQGGFAAGEAAAVAFSPDAADYPVVVDRLRLLVVPTQSASEGTTAEFTVAVFADDGQNAAGALLWSAQPALTASTQQINEVFVDPPVVVESGGFRVQLAFLEDFATLGMTIAQDNGPIVADRNFIFTGGAWLRASDLHVTGNWVIRAVAEVAESDGGSGGADGGSIAPADAGPDAGMPGADGGAAPAADDAGCGCGAPGGALALLVLAARVRHPRTRAPRAGARTPARPGGATADADHFAATLR